MPPKAVTLDIDDTVDVVHGHQQLSLFNAHYDERCFLPIHVYDTATSRPVAVILRPEDARGQGDPRPSAPPDPAHPPALAGDNDTTLRGDGHYGRPEVMAWCDDNAIDYVFGLPGNAVLDRASMTPPTTSAPAGRSIKSLACVALPRPAIRPNNWDRSRRACARIEATTKGLDIRFVVTKSRPPAPPSMSTRRSTAPAARPRT